MDVSGRLFDYSTEGMTFEGYVSTPLDAAANTKRPLVLVCHDWRGQDASERAAADRLAGLGYVAMAVDVYGKGNRGGTQEECAALMGPLVEDRAELQRRLALAIETGCGLDGVDASRVAAIGFCFGGLSVLDMARMDAAVQGVVSFHGLFMSAPNIPSPEIRAKVLALHGWDDPMATPESVMSFSEEMTAAGADWTLNAYGQTVHAFTNPEANDRANGTAYDPVVTRRAWVACDDFLEEVLTG